MCGVITAAGMLTALKVVGTVATLAGAAVSTASAIQQGKAQEAQYKYQAKVAQENADIAQENASRERQQGIEESRLQRLKAAQNVANQSSAMASNGIDITQGTAVNLLDDTAMWGEMDALNTLANSESRARAYEQEANNFKNQSRLDYFASQNAYKAGQVNALSSGLNGISSTLSVADKWYGFSGNDGNKTTNGISWGKLASGQKIAQQGNILYASKSSGIN